MNTYSGTTHSPGHSRGGCHPGTRWIMALPMCWLLIATDVAADELPVPWGTFVPTVACTEGKSISDVSTYAGPGGDLVTPAEALVRRCIRGTAKPGSYAGGAGGYLSLYDPQTNATYNFGGVQEFQQGSQTNSLNRLRVRPHFVWDLIIEKGKGSVSPRSYTTGVFDPFARRIVLYGGWNSYSTVSAEKDYNETWVYPVDVGAKDWTQLPITPPGPGRHQAMAVLDPIGRRMIVYGGGNAAGKPVGNQTLALSLELGSETWSEIIPAVKPPGTYERIYHGLVYDSRRHQVVLIGGGQAYAVPNGAFGDVWVLPLADPAKGWYEPPYATSPPDNAFVGTYSFYDVVTDAYYVYNGVAMPDGKKWGSSSANYKRLLNLWQIKPNPDGSLTWAELRTVFPGGYPLSTYAHWDPVSRRALSMTGINNTAKSLGGDDYYNREIRLYLLGIGGN